MKQWMVVSDNNSDKFEKKFFKTCKEAYDYALNFILNLDGYYYKHFGCDKDNIFCFNKEYTCDKDYLFQISDYDFSHSIQIINISQDSERLKVKQLKQDKKDLKLLVAELKDEVVIRNNIMKDKDAKIEELKAIMGDCSDRLVNYLIDYVHLPSKLLPETEEQIRDFRDKKSGYITFIAKDLQKTENMKVICSWCKNKSENLIRTQPCVPEMKDSISHSICKECSDKVNNDMKKRSENNE